ncbi:MAG: TlpA family protein disulfide reductase [Candidatus Aureabacteria bacterium]|nr:TlpA family protein disulfide reductase [Candidatus Auribacterota bacterium]
MQKKLLFLILFFLSVTFAYDISYSDEKKSLLGGKAPEIRAEKWLFSKPLSLNKLRGKLVVLDFWSTRCVPCKKSVEVIKELYKQYMVRGVFFVSLTEDELLRVRKYARMHNMFYPIGTSSLSEYDYNAPRIPFSVLINKKGIVIWEGNPGEGLKEAIDAAINQ